MNKDLKQSMGWLKFLMLGGHIYLGLTLVLAIIYIFEDIKMAGIASLACLFFFFVYGLAFAIEKNHYEIIKLKQQIIKNE